MILVDIQVPLLDKIYDFELDEEEQTGKILEEILLLIEQKEGFARRREGKLFLYALRQEGILASEETLKQQGVGDGDRLLLL
ncbi:MAG: hypothetical protein NC400_08195 [Clostridium sp.]|nr:hypothetical protein [Clostridium sp.]